MAVNEYIRKFSNEIYATENDVAREMKTPLIDGIWTQIKNYRTDFYETIPLDNYDGTKFSICLTPFISKNVNSFERRLTTIMNKYSRLQRNLANDYFRHKTYKKILRVIAKKYQIDTQDTVLDGIIDGTITYNLPTDQMILQRYFSCLQDIEQNYMQEISEDTIGDFYSKLMGTDELTSYYRKNDLNKYSGYSIGRTKIGVSPLKIENCITQLIKFINYGNQSLIVKAVSTFYYIYYVRPFENYSEEIALLMLKKVLAYNDVNSIAALLNFETLLTNKQELENKIGDCQKYYDLTYLVNYILKIVEPQVNTVDDDIVESQNKTIKEELYQVDPVVTKEEAVNKEPIFKTGPVTVEIPIVNKADNFVEKEPLSNEELQEKELDEIKHTEAIEVTPSFSNNTESEKETSHESDDSVLAKEERTETPEPEVHKEDEVKHFEEKDSFEENDFNAGRTSEEIEAYKSLTKPTQPYIHDQEKVTFSQNIAISNVPTGLSEEEATKLETHLMEMNPNLSHGQAYFYARHCTIGMYYTVDQYKKCVGCAYETARSSMNNLVVLGYYKKEQLKKKFVYIPVKRN